MKGGLKLPFAKKVKIMKYTILKDTVASGKKVSAGDVVELSEDEGKVLESYGKAVKGGESKSEKKDRSVGLETSEKPKVTKRKSK
jgi:hypothetical protein